MFVTVVFSVLGSNVQVCYTGLWGTVCDTNEDWDEAECAVSGRQRKLAEPDLLLGLEKLEGEGGSLQPGMLLESSRREREGERGGERGRGHSTEGARDEKLLRCEDREEDTDTERDGGGRDTISHDTICTLDT